MRTLIAGALWVVFWLAVLLPPAMAIDFDKPGPYAVGVRKANIADVTGLHPLRSLIWYPATGPIRDTAAGPIPASDGAAPAPGGPFPLVILIPAISESGSLHQPQARLLASQGFVVIASFYDSAIYLGPDPGQTAGNAFMLRLIYTRPANVLKVIAYADALTAAGGELAGVIGTDRIGVLGFTQGGMTALQAAGAGLDFQELSDWCSVTTEEALRASCQFLGREVAIAKAFGSDDPFGGPLPGLWDPRVAAVVAASPGGELHAFGRAGLAQVKVPTLVTVGLEDPVGNPQINGLWGYPYIGSPRKALATFTKGDTTMFMGSAPQFGTFAALTSAFFQSNLKGDMAASAALLPDAVSIPGVQYETTITGH